MGEMSCRIEERSDWEKEFLALLKARGLIKTVDFWSMSMIRDLMDDIDRERALSLKATGKL